MNDPTVRTKVAIDLAVLKPGKGGSGGGIWTYAKSLTLELDKLSVNDIEIICFVNKSQAIEFTNIKKILVPVNVSRGLIRLIWIHLLLPILCIWYHVDILHKMATEVPVLSPVKLVTTVHDFMNDYYRDHAVSIANRFAMKRIRGWYFRIITKLAIRRSNLIIVPTYTVAKEAQLRYRIPLSRLKVIYEGVATSTPPHESKELVRTGTKSILCVASFYPHKGHLNAIMSFELLVKEFNCKGESPKLRFRGHIRDKKYYQSVLDAISRSPYRNLMTVVDYNSSSKLTDIYGDASLVLLLSEYEGFGLPLVEAEALGIPVVCSNIPTFREILGDSAKYVPPDNHHKTADAVNQILNDPILRLEMVRKGLQNSERFSWSKAALQTMDTYKLANGD